jgi:O-antigen/teichoic acid export membrane protein
MRVVSKPAASNTSPPTLQTRTVHGALWITGSRLASQLIAFVGQVVLARVLAPSAFGLVASISVFTNFAQLMTDLGLAPAIVQARKLTDKLLATAFWVNFLTGIILGGVVFVTAPFVARFYGQPELTGLMRWMSLSFVLSLGIVSVGLLEREMRFQALAIVETQAILLSTAAAVIAGLMGAGASSLVVGPVLYPVLQTIGCEVVTRFVPSGFIRRDSLAELWRFGGGLTGFNVVNFWARNADNVLIGRYFGPRLLGFYSRAYLLMLLPVTQVTQVLSRVMLPALASIGDDLVRLREAYLRALGVVALATMPAMIGLSAVAHTFVPTVFGPKWDPAIRLVEVLALAGVTQCLAGTTGWLFQVTRRTSLMMKWGLVSSIIIVGSFVVGMHWGVLGVTISYTVVGVLLCPVTFLIPGRLIGLRLRDIGRVIAAPVICAAVMGLVVYLYGYGLQDHVAGVPLLISEVVLGTLTYAALLRVVSPRAFREAMALARGRFN